MALALNSFASRADGRMGVRPQWLRCQPPFTNNGRSFTLALRRWFRFLVLALTLTPEGSQEWIGEARLVAAATDQCSILRAEMQHFHSPVNAPVKAEKHYTLHRGDLRAQTVTARSVKLPSIQGFIAHADAPRSIRHTARWRARQLRAASPFASRTSVQAHAHNHANGMTRRRDAPRSGDWRRANKQGATSSQCNATRQSNATQRNATQHTIALQAPSASLSTVERCGQHTDLLSQLACLRYELVRDAKIAASLPARSRAQRRHSLKRCCH